MKVFIKVKGKLCHVGEYVEDKNCLYLIRYRSKHFFYRNNSWGIDKSLLELMFNRKATIKILEKEKPQTLTVSADVWKCRGIEDDFGHSKQVFLSEEEFTW